MIKLIMNINTALSKTIVTGMVAEYAKNNAILHDLSNECLREILLEIVSLLEKEKV